MAAAVLSACSAKSDRSATEKAGDYTGSVTQPETRQPDILILEETSAQAETTAAESAPEADTDIGLKEEAETKTAEGTAVETTAAKETEPAKVYAIAAFEKTMYATASVNVRASYTTRSEVLTSLSPGQKVQVTGRAANGWMRIIYNGRDAYVYQKYLDDSVPKARTERETAAVITYPGNAEEDPVTSPGALPIVEPVPITGAPGQNDAPGSTTGGTGNSVTEYGPGMITPGGGNSWSEPATPGYGPGMR